MGLGDNVYGELGDGTSTNRLAPVQVSGLSDVAKIASGGWHTIALAGDSVPAIIINSGAGSTKSLSVTVTLTCPNTGADCLQMQVSNDKSGWSTPEVFSTFREWPLTSGDARKTIYVKFQDTVSGMGVLRSGGSRTAI